MGCCWAIPVFRSSSDEHLRHMLQLWRQRKVSAACAAAATDLT